MAYGWIGRGLICRDVEGTPSGQYMVGAPLRIHTLRPRLRRRPWPSVKLATSFTTNPRPDVVLTGDGSQDEGIAHSAGCVGGTREDIRRARSSAPL